jgi:hypothetical protein
MIGSSDDLAAREPSVIVEKDGMSEVGDMNAGLVLQRGASVEGGERRVIHDEARWLMVAQMPSARRATRRP